MKDKTQKGRQEGQATNTQQAIADPVDGLILPEFTDLAEEWLKENPEKKWDDDDSPVILCRYCGCGFDSYDEGHTDDATGISFCSAPCEGAYDRETGLPRKYKRA